MVDSISLYMDGSMGGDDASSKEYAEENRTDCLYGRMCIAWFWVWHFVCTKSGIAIWIKFGTDINLDYDGILF